MPKKTIEDIVRARYDDDAVAEFILKDVQERGTADRIVSGELVLPGVEDATRNYQIATGTFAVTDKEREQAALIQQLTERVSALEGTHKPQPKK